MKKYAVRVQVFNIVIAICFFLIFVPDVSAADDSAKDFCATERFEIPSSPNPVGSGARALGMGGAFIAIADDATAASWNPGGLTQLRKPEISVVGAGFYRFEDNTYGPENEEKEEVSKARFNYLSAAIPIHEFINLEHYLIFSANYQYLYDFKREWKFSIPESTTYFDKKTDYDYELDGSLGAWGFALATRTKWLPQLSLGVTVNTWEDGIYKNEWKARRHEETWSTEKESKEAQFDTSDTTDHYSFSGTNFNIGFLWDVTGKITVGGVLKTPFKADVKYKYTEESTSRYEPAICEDDFTMEMPMSYGLGFAYRHSDTFTVSLDIYKTDWDKFTLKDNNSNDEISPVTGAPLAESDIDPTVQVRAGAEWLFVSPHSKYKKAFCLGAFYDPAPAQGHPDNFFGFSVGSGIADGEVFSFDVAYQYRFGNNVGESVLQHWGFSQDIQEHTVYASLIIYFGGKKKQEAN
ncbi:MAG: hypothetical protein BWK80_50080 [Desulfobacteraceae bacterium IS3]|nr:MAG: hypothetical protein BWK80_50080 [Desulfobacteraceae bacterium IS3]